MSGFGIDLLLNVPADNVTDVEVGVVSVKGLFHFLVTLLVIHSQLFLINLVVRSERVTLSAAEVRVYLITVDVLHFQRVLLRDH